VNLNGPALRIIRERSGLSITALADLAGVERSTISNIEAGRRTASPELAVSIAKALKVDLPAILADPCAEAPA
jgi:transcriptional regulator with XRE-family HTH domain